MQVRARQRLLPRALVLALAALVTSAAPGRASAEAETSVEEDATTNTAVSADSNPAAEPAKPALGPENKPLTATPANRRAARVLKLLARIQDNLTDTRYEHRTTIRSREGIYYWDCSAMAAYILAKVAPSARRALTRERPVARDFYQVIRKAPTRGDQDGWRRLRRITDVRPGDVFAWKRPKDFPSKNTGHVGFVLEAPIPAPGWEDAYLVRIADATSLPHGEDTRERGGGGGFGHGTILFTTDGDGHGTAYGWFGERSRHVIETPIAFGRLIR